MAPHPMQIPRRAKWEDRAAPGAKFSIQEFPNLVIGDGSMPLGVLGQEVDRWRAEQR